MQSAEEVERRDQYLNEEDKRLLSVHLEREVETLFDESDRPEGSTWICPFVPSSSARIQRFLELASLKSSDILYDIGCGDGRVLVTCVRETGCKGIGVDISKDCITQAEDLAQKEGVTQSITWHWADATSNEVNFQEANGAWIIVYMTKLAIIHLNDKLIQARNKGNKIVTFVYDLGPTWESYLKVTDNELGIFIYYDNDTSTENK